MEELNRLVALGNQLVGIHIRLREQLAALRESQGPNQGQEPPRDLADHCAGFCEALTRHHEGEDTGAFVQLEAGFPELAPVLDELRRDHALIADALRRLRTAATRQELDTLAALLETHFTYEERKLVAALNKLDPQPGAAILGG